MVIIIQIPITDSGRRCLVTNQSNENIVVSGILIHKQSSVDIFEENELLTELEVLGWLENSEGPLYKETTITNRLKVIDLDFIDLAPPDVIYGHDNRIVFIRSRQDVIETIHDVHLPLADASRIGVGLGSGPASVVKGHLIGLAFTLDTDVGYKNIRVPNEYFSEGALHINWTKSQDTDQSNNQVLWRVYYQVYDPDGGDATASPEYYIDFEDVYLDSGTTSRIVYKTDLKYLGDISPGNYIALEIRAITPAGSPLSEPVLISLDFTGKFKINKAYPMDM